MIFPKIVSLLFLMSFCYQLISCAVSVQGNEFPHYIKMMIEEHEINIFENEMSADMTGKIIGHAVITFERLDDSSKIADEIKSFMKKEFNHPGCAPPYGEGTDLER